MTYEEKLKKEKEVQRGQLAEEWFDKIGRDFFESEKKQILNDLGKAMPNELVAVQARYKELIALISRITTVVNDKNRAISKIRKETGGDNRES